MYRRGRERGTRRALLSKAVTLGAAGAAMAVARGTAEAAAGDPIKVDGAFTGAGTTSLTSSAAAAPAAKVENTGSGTGLEVVGSTGSALVARSAGESPTVKIESTLGNALEVTATNGSALLVNQKGTGVAVSALAVTPVPGGARFATLGVLGAGAVGLIGLSTSGDLAPLIPAGFRVGVIGGVGEPGGPVMGLDTRGPALPPPAGVVGFAGRGGTAVRAENRSSGDDEPEGIGGGDTLALEVLGTSRQTHGAVFGTMVTRGTAISIPNVEAGTGVAATSRSGTGVRGVSETGTGVEGESKRGAALHGKATGLAGLALRADGPVRFSTAGTGSFGKDAQTTTVSGVRLSRNAKILVTLSGDPGPDNGLKFVTRTSATSFDAELMKPAAARVGFSYFVLQ